MTRNVGDTSTFSFYDHVLSGAIRSVSHLVGMRRLSRPFWDRWRASGIGDAEIFGFLDAIGSYGQWPVQSLRLIEADLARLRAEAPGLEKRVLIDRLRRLSYLASLAQWGILPICAEKQALYRICRDLYIEAETLALGPRFRRIAIPFAGRFYPANLHLPETALAHAPVAVIVHGIDACKEEHLVTEQALAAAGFVAVGFDGPGQGEAFLLEGSLWQAEISASLSAVLDALAAEGIGDVTRAGLFGISFGALWSYRAAAADARFKAVYDLGGPTRPQNFARLPFLLKTMICQTTGLTSPAAIEALAQDLAAADLDALAHNGTAIRIGHGALDKVVSEADKRALIDALQARGLTGATMVVFPDGDHCATNRAGEVRRDLGEFLTFVLQPGPALPQGVAPRPGLAGRDG